MNIAIVHPYPVHAEAVGGVTRVYELARFLAARHQVSVFTHEGGPVPERDGLTEAGVVRQMYPRARKTLWSKARAFASDAPYYVHHNLNAALTAGLLAADRRTPFDVVHLELGYMAPVAAGLGPGTIRVLAEQEAMPFVLDRLRAVPWRSRTLYERLAVFAGRKVTRFDRATLSGFDLLYGITARERDYLEAASGRPAAILPHVVAMHRFPATAPGERRPHSVLFVGNFGHRPNVHAASWFVGEVWPHVRAAVPSAQFEIVGAGITDTMRAALAAPGVVISGYERDLAAAYRRSAVVVTPVHSGGGMRGKALEACAAGCALVSTSVGLDGIAATPGRDCLTADTAGTFAAAVVTYLGTPALRAEHGASARALVASRYDAPVVFGRLEHDYMAAHAGRAALARRTSA